jgi:carboxypeptidase T
MALKLLHQGILNKKERYVNMLRTTKFFFVPIINVDGAALVEQHWDDDRKIIDKRKNQNPNNFGSCGYENSGVDLNRNYGVDWVHGTPKNRTELCSDFWSGDEPFSEPESRAMRDFIAAHKNEIKFVINCHTSGNEFIWPYNGREPNDISSRNPGYLAIFQDIAKNAPFPDGVMKGNSYEVIGDVMGGDADDYVMSTFGIPSVTSEMGFFGQYIKDWRCQSKGVCFEILRENSRWIEYIFANIGNIADQLIIK